MICYIQGHWFMFSAEQIIESTRSWNHMEQVSRVTKKFPVVKSYPYKQRVRIECLQSLVIYSPESRVLNRKSLERRTYGLLFVTKNTSNFHLPTFIAIDVPKLLIIFSSPPFWLKIFYTVYFSLPQKIVKFY